MSRKRMTPQVRSKATKTVGRFLAYCSIMSARRDDRRLRRGTALALVLILPDGADDEDFKEAAQVALLRPGKRLWTSRDDTARVVKASDLWGGEARELKPLDSAILREDRLIILARTPSEVPAGVRAAVDDVIMLQKPTARHVTAAVRLCIGKPIEAETAEEIAAGDTHEQGECLRHQTFLLSEINRHEEALETALRAADLAAQLGDSDEQADSLRQLAFAFDSVSRHEEAVQTAKSAVELAAEANDIQELRLSLRVLGLLLGKVGRFDEAVEISTRAAELAGEVGDTVARAENLTHRALCLTQLERFNEAIETATHAAELAAEAGEAGDQTLNLLTLAFSLSRLERYEEAMHTAKRAVEIAGKLGETLQQANGLRQLGFALGKVGRLEEALKTASRAAELAAAAGDFREQAMSLRMRLFWLLELERYDEAWTEGQKCVSMARSKDDLYNLTWSIVPCLHAAVHVERPEVVKLFGDWLECRPASDADEFPIPHAELSKLFVAVARADAWVAFDLLLEENEDWLVELEEPVWFRHSDGEGLAKIGVEKGRAFAYEAMAQALPRIARLMEWLPEEARDTTWLPDITAGFAAACHDPGLLRDVATLLTSEIATQAEEAARLLISFAEVDEAEVPENVLARMDPDIATLIRLLRNYPEPEAAPGAKKRPRKKRG